MPHVSTDGPARPPYVNVAFQRGEIRRRAAAAAGCWVALSHVHTSSFYFFFILLSELENVLRCRFKIYVLLLEAMCTKLIFLEQRLLFTHHG